MSIGIGACVAIFSPIALAQSSSGEVAPAAPAEAPAASDESTAKVAAESRAAYAEHLFQEGVKLMKSDNCPKAVPKFLASQKLDGSAATLLNLATCQARLGRTASAWRAYRQAADEATREGSDELRDQAFKAISALDPALTKLKILAPPDSTPMSITLNGEPLAVDDGFPIPLDPGENIIEASAPGHQTWRHSVNASEIGTMVVIEVPDLPAASVAREHDARADWRTAGIIIGGAGVAAVIAGIALGLSAKSSYDDAAPYCRDGRCNAHGHDLREDAVNKANAATYVFGLGAAAAVGGAALWFFMAPARAKLPVGVAPWVSMPRSAGGIAVEGRL